MNTDQSGNELRNDRRRRRMGRRYRRGAGGGRGRYLWLKLTVACLLAACLVIALLSVLRSTRKPQAKGEYIEMAQAQLLLRELEMGELLPSQEQEKGQTQEDTAQTRSAGNESSDQTNAGQRASARYLTYGEFVQVLGAIHSKRPDEYTKEAYEYDKEHALSAAYAKAHYLLREDFFSVYYSLCERLVPDKEIREASFLVLGSSDEVADQNGTPFEEGGVLAADAGAESMDEAEYFEITFADYRHYLYETVTAVMSQSRVVLVLSAEADSFTFPRAWISSNTQEGLVVSYDQYLFCFPYQAELYSGFEKLADVTVTDGVVSKVEEYRKMVSGKLLGITEDSIELEGEGVFPYESNLQVYKLYGEKEPYTILDLKIGYAFTDFVLDDETIIAALVVREENMQNIRVLVQSQDFASDYHEQVTVTPDCDFVLWRGQEQTEYAAGTTLTFEQGDEAFDKGRVKVVPKNLTGTVRIDSLKRAQGTPSYHGSLELTQQSEGIAVINELLLEEYLYAVVPSEMPSSYPMEALKAQAVSARTYAYKNMRKSGIPSLGAHVNDSTAYQVYNNITQNERTTLAVRETQGTVLLYQGALADTYYYSTSCGYSTDFGVWSQSGGAEVSHLQAKHLSSDAAKASLAGLERAASGGQGAEDGDDGKTASPETQDGAEADSRNEAQQARSDAVRMQDEDAFRQMITTVGESDFEKDMDYYRWTYETELDQELLCERLAQRKAARPDQILIRGTDGAFAEGELGQLGGISAIEVTKRCEGGAACELVIFGEKQTVQVLSEYNIRYILLNNAKQITKQNGQPADVPNLLPSGFFCVETQGQEQVTGYRLIGGGYGHGIGMSQNGAKAMAEQGYLFDNILKFFFEGIEVAPADEVL